MVVPRSAVVEDVNTNSYRVFVIDEDDRAQPPRRAARGAAAGRHGEDPAGVKEGERVATSNLADLYDGAQVTVSADALTPRAGHHEASPCRSSLKSASGGRCSRRC